MRTYVMITGTVFGLLTLVHVWRLIVEGPGMMKDPWFMLITALSTSLAVWAWRVLRAAPKGTA